MRQQLSPNTPKIGLRLEYIGNVLHLSPRTFSPKDLVLVFERKMNPQQPTSAIRHININSQFSVGEKGPYPVYKYAGPKSQYTDMWATNACPIVFRYAEVLLTYAEAENELNGPSAIVYDLLNQVRNRVGMPDVDQTKYGTQATLRELIRRERTIEFAGEGLRRADILRWKDDSGKMVAETVLNGELTRITGTVDNSVSDPTMRATITGTSEFIENRSFAEHNRYMPIPQTARDANPNLEQNPGY